MLSKLNGNSKIIGIFWNNVYKMYFLDPSHMAALVQTLNASTMEYDPPKEAEVRTVLWFKMVYTSE